MRRLLHSHSCVWIKGWIEFNGTFSRIPKNRAPTERHNSISWQHVITEGPNCRPQTLVPEKEVVAAFCPCPVTEHDHFKVTFGAPVFGLCVCVQVLCRCLCVRLWRSVAAGTRLGGVMCGWTGACRVCEGQSHIWRTALIVYLVVGSIF